jgi:hypothetical protein
MRESASDVQLARLRREGRWYRLVALSPDGDLLYEHRSRWRRDYWLRRPDGSERPWNYRTLFGRKRPRQPGQGEWEWLTPRNGSAT